MHKLRELGIFVFVYIFSLVKPVETLIILLFFGTIIVVSSELDRKSFILRSLVIIAALLAAVATYQIWPQNPLSEL